MISPDANADIWTPMEGEATARLGDYLVKQKELPNLQAFESVKKTALDIAKRCKPFNDRPGQRTGIVVGYVQSGKTMSMTTVAAIARDSGCRIVIVLAGTTKILLNQSTQRFRKYLRSGGSRPEDWTMLSSERGVDPQSDGPTLRNAVAEWQEDLPEQLKKPLFITVMKNHSHLNRLTALLSTVNLRDVPVLVIDDEADQAGLNTRPDKKASTTYGCIRRVRAQLPNHTYLQYTATPQAPLLISLVDMLSPEFAQVIEAGLGYSGGSAFFLDNQNLVNNIPRDELFTAGKPPAAPPPSLLEALRVFFVGVAVALVQKAPGPRSMLVHPSERQSDHGQFINIVEQVRQRWAEELAAGPSDPDYDGVVEEFKEAYDALTTTCSNLPPFDDQLIGTLRIYLRRTHVHQVNSADGSEVDWDNGYSHVLVGGEKLNRGYTVRGLTVTYMPRSAGGWNADTIQQRARFFGYKQSYLGLCRVYLHPDVARAYEDYVNHERDIRSQLEKHGNRPLREWKRVFFLDARLRPTRSNVLQDPLFRGKSTSFKWFSQAYPHLEEEVIKQNRIVVDDFTKPLKFLEHEQYRQHAEVVLPLQHVMEQLLVKYNVTGTTDVVGLYAVRCWIADLLERDPTASSSVLLMSHDKPRHRTEDKNNRRVTLFEGRRSSGDNYPGDAKLGDSIVAVQLHRVNVATDRGVIAHVPAIAVWVPMDSRHRPDDVMVQTR